MSNNCGTLFVVATPIGNLEDMTRRAERVLAEVDYVAAEDTRRTRILLRHYGISARLRSLHEHNEEAQLDSVLGLLEQGESVALVSDAGTPLISDPGFRLVREARRRGLPVVPVPGASSVLAALSVAGLPTDRFSFEGFLSAKSAARRKQLDALSAEPRTMIFFESSHRIEAFIADMSAVFGAEREVTVARELTKTYETVRQGALGEVEAWLASDPNQRRGEFVVIVAGCAGPAAQPEAVVAGDDVLQALLEELPLKQATRLAARITGQPKNALYERALALKSYKDNK
ncbi:16S rRNA (cytidine(1402)-2'-O)-methyltransferase [Alkalilimnicola ehrlichii]|uniref:16S rRNA (cytidine(1402)-2'-O)-methyltransferase n=1 Tax=Alkalilimnicola ehrlichii TaxID=351052 RepID=UPI000E2F85FA|nr:16S rRNA (cytidine(1402)-2'-O)-methyltransferase [Alkalilimnicola ehrlichii]RFA30315.1 16S rRNA (cytidine(1402)-2'-O)-methyltransferase [Alkalilimnicola ehrlichii]